jgi:CspA family cold shock protein
MPRIVHGWTGISRCPYAFRVLPFTRTVLHERRDVRCTGRVKWFHENEGCGIIQPDAGGRNIQVHYADIMGNGFRTLYEGERVEFEIAEGPHGPRAKRVKPMPEIIPR